MAIVKWMKGIEFVSGALSKINKKSQHAKDQTMLLATHRKAPTENKDGCTRLYARTLENITRSTPILADEMARRVRFKAVSQAVAARAKNLASIATDQTNFLAQKDEPRGKKTMKSYLWSLELATYDASH